MISPVIYIMGVSGSGKTTVGQKLSAVTNIPFFDGDDFHPPANKEKMRAGQPLNDDDRKDWLLRINQVARERAMDGGAIIACSALKEKYRTILADSISGPVYWVFLRGEFNLISERMKARKGHYMPESLLQSQFDILEIPSKAMVADISDSPDVIVKKIVEHFQPF